ncbi:MAG: SIR2 family protein [Pseudomonadota bacterium]
MTTASNVIESELIDLVRQGRVILFLGSGASLGAKDKDGHEMPSTKQLSDRIAEKFLSAEYKNADLQTVYDLACSNRSTREAQRFLHDTLIDFQPTDEHLLLPKFSWAGLATTNYDLLIERAFDAAGQRVDVYAHDGGLDLTARDARTALYLKLHGSVLDFENIDAPLVTSTEQILNYKKGRANLFKQFLEWGQTQSHCVHRVPSGSEQCVTTTPARSKSGG